MAQIVRGEIVEPTDPEQVCGVTFDEADIRQIAQSLGSPEEAELLVGAVGFGGGPSSRRIALTGEVRKAISALEATGNVSRGFLAALRRRF